MHVNFRYLDLDRGSLLSGGDSAQRIPPCDRQVCVCWIKDQRSLWLCLGSTSFRRGCTGSWRSETLSECSRRYLEEHFCATRSFWQTNVAQRSQWLYWKTPRWVGRKSNGVTSALLIISFSLQEAMRPSAVIRYRIIKRYGYGICAIIWKKQNIKDPPWFGDLWWKLQFCKKQKINETINSLKNVLLCISLCLPIKAEAQENFMKYLIQW